MSIRPEYQQLIEQCNETLPEAGAIQVSEIIERWDRYKNIQQEFFNRPEGVTVAQIKRELAKKYFTSESNIEKIAYEL